MRANADPAYPWFVGWGADMANHADGDDTAPVTPRSTARLIAREALMCGLKSIPLVGTAVDFVDGVAKSHEALAHAGRLAEVEAEALDDMVSLPEDHLRVTDSLVERFPC